LRSGGWEVNRKRKEHAWRVEGLNAHPATCLTRLFRARRMYFYLCSTSGSVFSRFGSGLLRDCDEEKNIHHFAYYDFFPAVSMRQSGCSFDFRWYP
jgi:hypothetical protein